VQFQKISRLPQWRGLQFPGGGWFWKTKKFNEMYEAYMHVTGIFRGVGRISDKRL